MAVPAAVLWDMDGTIVDSEPLWYIGLDEAATRLGRPLTPEVAHRMTGTDQHTTMRILAGHTGAELGPDELAFLHDAVVDRVITLLKEGPPFHSRALEVLRGLRSAGVPLALVTSSPRHVAEITLAALPPDLFATVVTAEDVTARKPDPAPYLQAARALGADPSRCWAVEDSTSGAASAQSAGCRVFLAPSALATAHAPGRTPLASLDELLGDLV